MSPCLCQGHCYAAMNRGELLLIILFKFASKMSNLALKPGEQKTMYFHVSFSSVFVNTCSEIAV